MGYRLSARRIKPAASPGGMADKAHRLARGDRLVSTVESLAPGGEAVMREQGVPIFVRGLAPGDRAEIELFDVRKDFARASVVQILEPSCQRAVPPCKLFGVCGGCQWQHLSYEWQLKAKEDIVRQTLKHIAKLDPELVRPSIGADDPLHYRNKVQFPVEARKSGRILAGYYKADSHELVNIKHCPVQPEPLDRMLDTAKSVCEDHRLTAYDEKKRTGLLRHITARYSFDRKSVLVTLVVNAHSENRGKDKCRPEISLPEMQRAAREIMDRCVDVTGVCLNYNPQAGNRIIGDTTVLLAGEPYIIERLATTRDDLPERLRQGLEFKLSPASFFQVNTAQCCRLFEQIFDAIADAALPAGSRVPVIVDAYAGVGAIALWLSPIAGRVIAVEEHPAAVADGKLNLELNKVDNVEFRLGGVEEVFLQFVEQRTIPDVLVVDPPRSGLSPQAMGGITALGPLRMVYVSCNPATLARDLRILEKNGYKTKQIQPVDLFPQTYHIETVTVLERHS